MQVVASAKEEVEWMRIVPVTFRHFAHLNIQLQQQTLHAGLNSHSFIKIVGRRRIYYSYMFVWIDPNHSMNHAECDRRRERERERWRGRKKIVCIQDSRSFVIIRRRYTDVSPFYFDRSIISGMTSFNIGQQIEAMNLIKIKRLEWKAKKNTPTICVCVAFLHFAALWQLRTVIEPYSYAVCS